MKDFRKLTGKWKLQPRLLGGYNVLVQVITSTYDDPTYGNGGGSFSPEFKRYEKAKDKDLKKLKIKVV